MPGFVILFDKKKPINKAKQNTNLTIIENLAYYKVLSIKVSCTCRCWIPIGGIGLLSSLWSCLWFFGTFFIFIPNFIPKVNTGKKIMRIS